MIPKIIHQTARSKDLSWEERRMVRRLRRIMPDWQYRLWDDDDNSRLVKQCFPQHHAAYEAIQFGVAKSDIARYAYLYAHGGFYVDTDYKMLRAFGDELLSRECIIPLEGAKPQDRLPYLVYLGIGNAVMGSRAGHRFWEQLINHIFEANRPQDVRYWNDVLITTGPRAVTNFFSDRMDEFPDVDMPEKNLFYPDMQWMATRTSASRDTYGVHLHWGSWRGKSVITATKTLARRKLNGLLS